MSRAAVSNYVQPERALLTNVYANVPHLSAFQQVLAPFVNQELGIFEEIALVRDHPVGTRASSLLVTHSEKDDVSVQRNLLALEHDHHDQLRQALVLHVLSASPVNRSVQNLSAKRRNPPMGRVAGHDIHVVKQDDRTLGISSAMRDSRPKIRPSGKILEKLVFYAFLIEGLLEECCRPHLVAWRVGGIYPQVLTHPLDGKVGVLLDALGGDCIRSSWDVGGFGLLPA